MIFFVKVESWKKRQNLHFIYRVDLYLVQCNIFSGMGWSYDPLSDRIYNSYNRSESLMSSTIWYLPALWAILLFLVWDDPMILSQTEFIFLLTLDFCSDGVSPLMVSHLKNWISKISQWGWLERLIGGYTCNDFCVFQNFPHWGWSKSLTNYSILWTADIPALSFVSNVWGHLRQRTI